MLQNHSIYCEQNYKDLLLKQVLQMKLLLQKLLATQ